LNLSPLDADPATPQSRNFTTTQAALDTGWYKIIFLDASDLEDPFNPVQFPALGYPTVTELVGDSSLVALTALPIESQETLYIGAKLAVEEYTGQIFDFQPGVEKVLDGSGRRTLYLPKRLETITAIDVTETGLTLSDVLLADEKDRVDIRADAGISNYYVRALMEVQGNPPMQFTYGVGTVRITGDWGWSAFPQAVRDAMRMDMEDQALSDTHALSETLRAYRKLGIREITQDKLEAGFGPAINLSDRVRALLDPYVWQGRVGVAF
jgi:hypothetical protein